jgi:hypothetical protein
VNLDWRRLKAVVFESDDWGLCAWCPDEQAFRVLAGMPAFRSESGRRYAGSTLESAQDVRLLADTLLEFRGGDGFPPVWQANTIMAAPDYSRLVPPLFDAETLPLIDFPETPSRWRRPGLRAELGRVCASGLWWPELHGLHHLPEHAWLTALRRGTDDARRAHEHQSPVCAAVEGSGEYDPSEPRDVRARNFALAAEKFTKLFGRAPSSMCPPDYRWDEDLEADAERSGLVVFQGLGEKAGHAHPRLRRALMRWRWPDTPGRRFYMPLRTAFEPHAAADGERLVETVARAARDAWSRGQPAVISTHRLNYAHLDATRAAAGRAALRDLLKRLIEDGAVFLVDAEVRALHDRSWSVRPVGDRGALVRYYGVPRAAIRFPAPPGARRVTLREGRSPETSGARLENGEVVAELNVGEYLFEWGEA